MQLRIHAHNLEEYLLKQGIAVPDEVKLHSELLRDKGTGERIERFISKHPTEVFNSIIGAASAGMMYSGAKALAKKDYKRANSLWAGLMVAAGAFAGLVIKEDPDAPKKAANGNFIDKTVAFVKQQPLRLSSTLYLLNDIFIVNRALGEFDDFKASKGADKRFIWPTIAAVANIVGNGLLFLSRRNQLKENFSDSQIAQFEDLAANAVNAQPQSARDYTASAIGRYMRQEKISNRSTDQLKQEILEKSGKPGSFGERVGSGQQVASPALLA